MNSSIQITPGGISDDVFVFSGASLDNIPPSHRFLLTDEISTAFGERQAFFESLAEQCTLRCLKEFCEKVSKCDHWVLQLCKSNDRNYFGDGLARFRFQIDSDQQVPDSDSWWLARLPSIEIHSNNSELQIVAEQLPHCFKEFYSLFTRLSFDEFGGSVFWHPPISAGNYFEDSPESRWVFHCDGSDLYTIDLATERIHCRNAYETADYQAEGEPAVLWMEQYFSAILEGVAPLPGI